MDEQNIRYINYRAIVITAVASPVIVVIVVSRASSTKLACCVKFLAGAFRPV